MSIKKLKIGLLSILMVFQMLLIGGGLSINAEDTSQNFKVTTDDSTNKQASSQQSIQDLTPTTTPPLAPIMPSTPKEEKVNQMVQPKGYDLEGGIFFVDQSDEGNSFFVKDKIKLYNQVKLHGASDNLTGGYSILTLSKEGFTKPNPDNISSSPKLKDIVITSDDTNYYIRFNYETLISGSEAGIPFEVSLEQMQRISGKQTIYQTIYDADGNLLASASKDILTNANLLTLHSYNLDQTIDRNNVDSANVIINPVTYDLDGAFMAYTDAGRFPLLDERDVQFELTLPNNVSFIPKEGWVFDAATNTLRYIFQWDESYPQLDLEKILPTITTKNGVKIGDVSIFHISLTLQNEDGTLDTSTKQEVKSTIKYVLPKEYSLVSKIESVYCDPNDVVQDSYEYVQDIEANNYSFLELIHPIYNVPKDYTEQISVNEVSMKPRSIVFPNGQVKIEMSKTTNSSLAEAIGHNQLIGTTMDDQNIVLAKDIQPNGSYVDYTYSKYKELKLVFDSPLQFITVDEMDGFQISFKGLVDKTNVDYVNFKKDTTTDSLKYFNDLAVTTTDKQTRTSNFQTLAKGVASISNSSVSIDSGSLYFGHTSILTSIYATDKPEYLKDSTVQNAIVYFLLPNGVVLDEQSLDQVVGLKDVAFTQNVNGTGLNLISGKPTTLMKPDEYKRYIFKVPIVATELLRKGNSYPLYSYLSFDNNAGSSDLTTEANQYDYLLSDSDPLAIQLGLYKYSHDPNMTVGGSSTFTYAPPTELITTTQVKKDGTDIYVEDTGNTTDAGDLVNYRLNVFNNGLDDVPILDSINVLPRVGDMMQVPDENGNLKERGSKFNVYLDGPVTVPEGFQVQYSSDTPTGDARENAKATWVDTPANYQDVTMIRITMNSNRVLKATEEVNFDYNAILDSDTSIPDGSKAYNTYATSVNTDKDFMESTSATTSIVFPTVNINITKEDADDSAIKLAGAEFQLYAYDTDEVLLEGRTFTSDKDGSLTIADLKPGTYYLVETKTPNGYHKNDNEKEVNKFVVERKASTDIELTITNGKNEGIPPILPIDEGTIDVAFVDTNGTTIASNTQLHGPDTMAVDFKAPDFDGYTFVKYIWSGVSDEEIFVGDTTQNITAIYQSDTTTPSPNPTTPGTGIVSTLPYFVALITLAGVVLFVGYRKKKFSE